jgi:hypothetical protein
MQVSQALFMKTAPPLGLDRCRWRLAAAPLPQRGSRFEFYRVKRLRPHAVWRTNKKDLHDCYGTGKAVPDFDLTNEMSALLIEPSAVTSSLKLELVTAWPD